jgi:hypothetical protein
MIAISVSRALRVSVRSIGAFLFVAGVFCAPQRIAARTPQSSDPPPSPQQLEKKDPATAVNNPVAPRPSPKPRHVFTNDDFSSSTDVPIAPGAYRRLKQLNRCDHQCFNEVKKQALNFGYTSVYPRLTREEMDNRLAGYIEDLQNDPKWQKLLLQMISAHFLSCEERRKYAAAQGDSPQTPTRGDLRDQDENMKNYRPPAGGDYNAAGSAVLAYRFSSRPDPLKASLMVRQYMDELHQECPQPQTDTDDNDEDP